MTTAKLAVIVLVFAMLNVLPAAAVINEQAVFQEKTYFLLWAESGAFGDLEAEAVALGGHLTSVNSQEEQDFISNRWGGFAGILCIGYTDQMDEGTFTWVSGEPVVFTNWGPGEPSNVAGDEDSAVMRAPGGMWSAATGCLSGYAVAKVSGPVVNSGGVLNAASYAVDGFPNDGIGQGSLFVAFGSIMGPGELQYAPSLPLPTELAGTSLEVAVNGTTVMPFLIYTSSLQLAAVLPSNTPVGQGTLTVTFDGETSQPVPIKVVRNTFGIFTRNQAGFGPAIVQNFISQTKQPMNAFTQAASAASVLRRSMPVAPADSWALTSSISSCPRGSRAATCRLR